MLKIFAASVLTLFFSASAVLFVPNHALAATSSSSDIKVQTINGPTVAEKLAQRTKASWPWYITRASGLVAAGALVIMLVSGIGLVTGYTFKFLEPLTAWASHRALGLVFGGAVLVHIFTLLFDRFISFNFVQILVPFVSDYKRVTIAGVHVGSLYVALGILAFYGTLIIILTSLLWVEKKPRLWKLIHLLSYLVMFDVFLHALYLGTDLAHGVFRWLWVIGGVTVAISVIHRLKRARTI